MKQKYLFLAIIVLLLACGYLWWENSGEPNLDGAVGEFWGTIMGTVMLGPTCPVVMDPPDPECADKPYTTNLVLTSADGAKVLKTFSSDNSGKFSIDVPPGQYSIRSAASGNVLPYCQSSESISLDANSYVEVVVSCDTGIR